METIIVETPQGLMSMEPYLYDRVLDKVIGIIIHNVMRPCESKVYSHNFYADGKRINFRMELN